MKPTDALLYRRILEDMLDRTPDAFAPLHDPELAQQMAMWLPQSEVYYVSGDMTAIVRAAAPSMPPQELSDSDVPSSEGWLIFDEPVTHADVPLGRLGVRGFAWCTGLLSREDPRPCVAVYLLYDMAKIPTDAYPKGGPHMLMPLGTAVSWPFGAPPEHADTGFDHDPARLLLATWTLMQQSLTVTVRAQADRAERKRWLRRRIEPPMILIVRLRRLNPEGEGAAGESDRTYSHRWLVGGHWRNQWLPSRSAHRLQWISPYVKGPANLPLVVKDRVTAWVR